MNSRADVLEIRRGKEAHTVVVMQRVGRLGNQIGLLANLIAFSLATGVRICHPTLGKYGNYFAGTADALFCCYPRQKTGNSNCLKSTRVLLYYFCRLLDQVGILKLLAPGRTLESDYQSLVDMSSSPFLAKVHGGRFTFLTKGWFFRYTSIVKHHFLTECRQFFDLAEPHKSNVLHIVSQARKDCDVLIGVHIRQTDFKDHAGGKHYFNTADYARLMRHCQDIFQPAKVGFLVVSDEPHNSSDFPSSRCSFGSGIDIEDMYCLGGCDYIIGSIASSYCLWPAVLFQVPIYQISNIAYAPRVNDFRVIIDPWEPQ